MSAQYAVAKPGREALNLRFETISHIDSGPVRHVAVGPECVLPLRERGSDRTAMAAP